MTTTYTNHEDMAEPPKKQVATSLFKQALGSLPAAILLALGGTWVAFHIGLPEDMAKQLSYAIWGSCLIGGTGSTLNATSGLASRSNLLTQAKIEVQRVAAAALLPSPDDGGETDVDNAG
jgi:hypothetical protein